MIADVAYYEADRSVIVSQMITASSLLVDPYQCPLIALVMDNRWAMIGQCLQEICVRDLFEDAVRM
jgi:hypothetical protein